MIPHDGHGYEVAVIGAGVHGASAAYHLARREARVVVIERLTPAGGPTGVSSGVCRAYYTNTFLGAAARDSIRMMAAFDDIGQGHDAGFRRTGFLYLHPPQDREPVATAVARLNELGIRVDLLQTDVLRESFGMFSLDDVGVGAFEHDAGYADPAGTTAGMIAGARAAGAVVRSHANVTGLRLRPGGGGVLELGTGESLEADRVLIAAGPWTAGLARLIDVDLPLTVERHVVATLRADPRPIPFGHSDLIAGYYCRPEGSEQFLMGWTHPGTPVDPNAYDTTSHRDEQVDLVDSAARRLPALRDAQPLGGWAGLYDVSPDWQPVIGEIADGIFVDAGTSGHGFKLAPALGKSVADLILGDPDPEIGQFHPGRFVAGQPLQSGYREARILG